MTGSNQDKLRISDRLKSIAHTTQIPNEIITCSKISIKARLLWIAISKYAFRSDEAFPGQEKLSEDLDTSKRTVQRKLKELEESGLIHRRKENFGGTNIYTLFAPENSKSSNDDSSVGNESHNNDSSVGVGPNHDSSVASIPTAVSSQSRQHCRNCNTESSGKNTHERGEKTQSENHKNNKYKNNKYKKEDRIGNSISSLDSNSQNPYQAHHLASLLVEKIREHNPRTSLPDPSSSSKRMNRWIKTFDRAIRIGPINGDRNGSQGYTPKELKKMLEWAFTTEYWSMNITSARKFRKSITTIENQMNWSNQKKEKEQRDKIVSENWKDKCGIFQRNGCNCKNPVPIYDENGELKAGVDNANGPNAEHTFL